jgi:hypothetical protein
MIQQLITLVIYLIVIGLIIWLLLWALQQVPMPAPFAQVARVLIIVIGVLIVCYLLLGLVGGGPGPLHLGLR